MLDHVSITVTDLAMARPFYDAIMAALGQPKVWDDEDGFGYGLRSDADFPRRSYMSVRPVADLTPDRRHWCFKAESRAMVRAFHMAALAHGGKDDGAPGLRAEYHPTYYAAFVLDPDGNRLEAVCHTKPAGDDIAPDRLPGR
jgi:catechol 2,3-dioxygenase-like lactoylglutathione lyase family enzyme